MRALQSSHIYKTKLWRPNSVLPGEVELTTHPPTSNLRISIESTLAYLFSVVPWLIEKLRKLIASGVPPKVSSSVKNRPSTFNILVVDNDASVADEVAGALEIKEDVRHAKNFEEAIWLSMQRTPSCVLLALDCAGLEPAVLARGLRRVCGFGTVMLGIGTHEVASLEDDLDFVIPRPTDPTRWLEVFTLPPASQLQPKNAVR